MNRRLFVMPAILATVAAAISAGSAGAAPSAPAAARAALTPADLHGGDVADKVDHFPAYAGIRVTPDHGSVEIYVTRADAALHAAAVSAAHGAPIRLTTVRYPYAVLSALKARVSRDSDALARAGVSVVYIAVRDELNKVGVGISDYTAAKAAAVMRRYPAGMVAVTDEGPARLVVSRESDVAPWNGGTFIYTSFGQTCTSGPAVQNAANETFIMTAAHCYVAAGQTVSSYTISTWQKSPKFASGPFFGNAKAERAGSVTAGYDIALVDMSDTGGVSGLDFRTDPPAQTGTLGAPQKRTIRAIIGTGMCSSGAYSGERCAAHVDVFDGEVTASGTKIMHVNRLARDVSTEPLAGPGDSGGPVYQVQSDGLAIGGFIEATNSGLTCTNNDYWQRTNTCGNLMYFAGIGSALAHTGMSLYIG